MILSLQRAILVNARAAQPLTAATVIAVAGIAIMFVALSRGFAVVGVTAAVTASLIGRVVDVVLLTNPCLRGLRRQSGGGGAARSGAVRRFSAGTAHHRRFRLAVLAVRSALSIHSGSVSGSSRTSPGTS